MAPWHALLFYAEFLQAATREDRIGPSICNPFGGVLNAVQQEYPMMLCAGEV